MNGGKPSKDSDEKRFNETLKRMLETPPKPKEKTATDKRKVKRVSTKRSQEKD